MAATAHTRTGLFAGHWESRRPLTPPNKPETERPGRASYTPHRGEAALPGKGGRQAREKATAAQPRTRATRAITLPFAGACQQLPRAQAENQSQIGLASSSAL